MTNENIHKTTATVAMMGDVLTETQKDRNKWKKRMLKAGITGLDFPEDWDTLSEDEKERRLNKVIEVARKGE